MLHCKKANIKIIGKYIFIYVLNQICKYVHFIKEINTFRKKMIQSKKSFVKKGVIRIKMSYLQGKKLII